MQVPGGLGLANGTIHTTLSVSTLSVLTSMFLTCLSVAVISSHLPWLTTMAKFLYIVIAIFRIQYPYLISVLANRNRNTME